jgi:DNA modification methylase
MRMRQIAGTTEPSVAGKFRARDIALATSPEILNSRHRIFLGDARTMAELNAMEQPVHLVVPSPPYWTLKEYRGSAGDAQLGHVEDYEAFHDELDKVWRRCHELLIPGGRLCIVVGDVCLPRRKTGRHRVMPLHADISLHCRHLGFDYLTPILWHKIANAITEVDGNGSGFLGKPYEPNAIVKNDVEYILLLRKPGAYRAPNEMQRLLSLIDKQDHARWFRSIWTDVPGSARNRGHPAPFPEELAYRLVRMFSFVGDTVLDPFLGTGTTTEAAIRANRSSIGYEIEPEYLPGMKNRFSQITPGVEIEFFK